MKKPEVSIEAVINKIKIDGYIDCSVCFNYEQDFEYDNILYYLEQERELQEKIDKAIEYIKENEFYLDYKTGACIKGVMPLLNILKGEDK